MLTGLGMGALAWRLAQGPLELTWLEARARLGVALADGTHLTAQSVSLAWDGWNNGISALPAIRLDHAVLGMPGLDATAERVLLHLSMTALLRGELAPALLELTTPVVTLRANTGPAAPTGEASEDIPTTMAPWLAAPDEGRRHLALRGLVVRDGSVLLPATSAWPETRLEGIGLSARRGADGLRATGAARLVLAGSVIPIKVEGAGAAGASSLQMRATGLQPALLARLVPSFPALARLETEITATGDLRLDAALTPRALSVALESGPGRYRLAGAELAFQAATLQAEIHPESVEIPSASLRVDDSLTLTAHGRARREAGLWLGEVEAGLAQFDLATLAARWPETLAPGIRAEALRLIQTGQIRDAHLALSLRETQESARLTAARLLLPITQARLGPGQGVAVAETLLVASGTPDDLRVEQVRITLPSPREGAAPSIINAQASIHRQDGGWRIGGGLTLDQLALADLPSLWPEGVGGGTRKWLTENLTAGQLRDGQWQAELFFPDAGAPQVQALSGRARAVDVTVHWLAPIPPAVGVSGEAQFGPEQITLTLEGGRQARADGSLTAIEIPAGGMRFYDLNAAIQRAELNVTIGGPMVDMLAVLRHPRLRLFERRPLDLNLAEGSHTTRLTIGFPLLEEIPNDAIRVRAESRISNLRLLRTLLGRDLENGQAELVADQDRLRVQGTATMLGAPLRLLTELDFRPGPNTQIIARESVQGTASAAQLAQIGFDLGDVLGGSVAIDARTERRRNGQSAVTLRGDLAPASLSLPAARWGKAVGSPGSAEAILRLQGDNLVAVENGRLDVLELSLRGRAIVTRGRIERYEIAESLFGGSRFQGDVRPPSQPGAPWQTSLRGPLLDLRPIFGEGRRPAIDAGTSANTPPVVLEARFDRVTMGDRRELFGVQGRAVVDERSVLRQGFLRGRTAIAGGSFELNVAPRPAGRSLRITAEDGGAVLRAMEGISSIEGGQLTMTGGWADNEPNATLSATAQLDGFVVRGAPAIGKVLQAMTLYGLVDALQGGAGLNFTRAEIPFTLSRDVLTLNDARAFSPSLGLTARGRILREADILDLEGTVVPAYMFNSILGNLPLLGRLFSPEPGGGVFATTFRAQGAAGDPQVQVNPLATLTPGFLRGLFGLGQEPASISPRSPRR